MCAKTKTQKSNLLFTDDFYSDITMDGMIYASILRSPFPKGRIINIPTDRLPEGYTFLGWDDVPAKKTIKSLGTDMPVFCQKDITYLGQPVGIIAGPNRKQVRQLCKTLPIEIDEHYYYEEAEETDSGDILAQREVQYGTDYELKPEDTVIEGEWESEINVQNYTETNGAICQVKGSKLYVYAPNLWISNLRKTLSDVTGFSEENIIITRTKLLSKTTNILWLNSLICCQCAVAAINLKKIVKLEFTRTEQELYAENTSSVKIRHSTTVNPAGLIKAMNIVIHVNAGAYNPFAQEIADRLAISSTGVYKCPNIKISSNIYRSHSIPSSIDFSIIDSKAFFAIENQMNLISRKIGIDPLELRKLNLKIEDKHNKSPVILETGKAEQALDAICKKSIFLRKNAVYKTEDAHRFDHDFGSPYAPPLRGIGLVCAYEGTGYLGSRFIRKNINIEVTFTKEKKLYIRGIPSSNNIWKIWKKQASEITEIPEENIYLDTNFNNLTEPENPQTSESSISITTQLVKKACAGIAKKLKDSGTQLPVTVKKSFSLTSKKDWNDEKFEGYPFSTTSFASMVMELELEAATYKAQPKGIWFCVDAGQILNPRIAETSIRNAIQEELREVVADDEIETNSINILFVQSDDEPKQIGEVVKSLLPAAYASALSQAVGNTISNLPVQSDTVYKITEELKTIHNKLTADEAEAGEE